MATSTVVPGTTGTLRPSFSSEGPHTLEGPGPVLGVRMVDGIAYLEVEGGQCLSAEAGCLPIARQAVQ